MSFGVPECDYVPSLKSFRVRKASGKHFSSGSFGMALTLSTASDENEVTTTTNEYLFIEEVLFLFERGVLNVYSSQGDKLNSMGLYGMLEVIGVPLPISLVYAHLRSQDYRVLQHVKNVDSQQQQLNNDGIKEARRTKTLTTLHEDPTSIVFDVYKPNSLFKKMDPGIPESHVAVANFQYPSPTFDELQALLSQQQDCSKTETQTVPALKIATVSDSGVVIMFGMTNVGVPDILIQTNETNEHP